MNQYLLAAFAAMALCLGSPAHAQAAPPARTAQAAPPEADSAAWVTVTVVVEIQLRPKTEAVQAHAAVDDLRAMLKRQPGFISEVFLKNLNPANAPQFIHVSRWASMARWAAWFNSPEFSELNAHGNEHFTLTAAAFVPADSLP